MAADSRALSLVPRPQRVESLDGRFVFGPDTSILVQPDHDEVAAVGGYLAELLSSPTGFRYEAERSDETGVQDAVILSTQGADPSLGEEGYELAVNSERIEIRAVKAEGLFRGVQTLRQLLPPEVESPELASGTAWEVPAVRITDKPRFQWRGLMLDVGRHFFPLTSTKRLIDLLALHRMNVLHFHLTEDQGWRIEIKKHSRLTSVSSNRRESPKVGNRHEGDGKPYGGFYTQDEIREIVAYAVSRYITVVPEIELPGHSQAVLAAYPELGCTGGPYEVATRWGVHKDVYCAGKEETFEFLQDVFDEVLDLFPSEYIHIGGDECPKDRWKECEFCQARIESEGLADEHELQSYFIARMEKYLNARGRQIIGWDEILEGGLAPNAAVMSWRGVEGGIKAANAGHNVVMSPTSHCYFDYCQSEDKENEPEAIGGLLPLEQVYSLDPVPGELPADKHSYIIGVQGNVWTEYIRTPEEVDYMTFPRACALAEVAWTPPELRDWDDFRDRLDGMLRRLDVLRVHYRKP